MYIFNITCTLNYKCFKLVRHYVMYVPTEKKGPEKSSFVVAYQSNKLYIS